MSIVGKLYRYQKPYMLLGMTEQQYVANFVVTLIRIEKIMSHPIGALSGFDIPRVTEGDVILLLNIHEQYFAGDLYKIYKILKEDQIIFLSMSNKRIWNEYFQLLETV
jgi:hypothetical protein